MTNRKLVVIAWVLVLFSATVTLSSSTAAETSLKEFFESLGLTDTEGRPVTILSAELITNITGVPEHVRLEGIIWPETRFVIKLPVASKWNGRYYQIGGGGLGGVLQEANMLPALKLGYATGGNNQGHNATKEPGATFAYPDPIPGIRNETNPYWERKEDDYAYRATHETAILAKKIIKAYYGTEPLYSYFVGASNGGREGLKIAQMYPEDFDGMVIGMPVLNITWEALQDIWNAKATLVGPGAIPVSNLPMLAKAVYQKCDSIDGLVDGLIDDPRICLDYFNPVIDLALPPYSDHFTYEQRESLLKIYEGPKTSWGLQLFYGTPPGGEALMRHVFGRIMSNWAFWVCGEPNLALSLGGSLWQYMATDPRFGPGWDWRTFNFDTDPFKLRPELAEKLNAIDPDLRAFKERGGKIIMWHGWADQLVTPYQSIAYYESVMKFMGENSTKEFFKLYMVPGLTHVGSIGCSDVDWFSALVNWVENGIEPGILIGSRKADAELNLTARTRPIPPYPMVARYIGNGSIDDAKNFVCVNLIPAEVRIEPKIINLDKGNFTAFVNIPEGYSMQNILAVICEGAAARRVYFAENGRTLVAEFNSKNLINITPREDWVFAVTVIFESGGQMLALEGCDVVNVFELDFRQEYYKLLENYTSLNDKYQLLSESFNKLQSDYDKLESDFEKLKSERDDLYAALGEANRDYDQLKSDFDKLKSEHDQLRSDLERLKSERDDLYAALDEANRDYEALLDEYEKFKPWQYIAYTFIALTILFIATNIYFLRKAKRNE